MEFGTYLIIVAPQKKLFSFGYPTRATNLKQLKENYYQIFIHNLIINNFYQG